MKTTCELKQKVQDSTIYKISKRERERESQI